MSRAVWREGIRWWAEVEAGCQAGTMSRRARRLLSWVLLARRKLCAGLCRAGRAELTGIGLAWGCLAGICPSMRPRGGAEGRKDAAAQ